MEIQEAMKIIEKQKEDIEDYEKILDIYDERKYRRQYLEEERAKRKNLLYPDSDEIYQKYFEQKTEIERLKSMELKAKGGVVSITLEGLINLENEIKKKDKQIDLMAEELVKAHEWFYSEFDNYTKEDFIKYFEKKSEEDK